MAHLDLTEENIEAIARRAYEVVMDRQPVSDRTWAVVWDGLDCDEQEMRLEFVRDVVDAVNHCATEGFENGPT